MKRTLAFMLALVLICSLSITAFAADNGSITITNATVGETYAVYKIFDATFVTETNDQGEEVVVNNADGNPMIAYRLTDNTLIDLMFGTGAVEFTDIGKASDFFDFNAETNVVTKKSGIDNEKMFNYLGQLAKNHMTATDSDVATSGTVAFDGLDTGYYAILRSNDQTNAVTITTTKPHADVIDKSLLPGGDFTKTVSETNLSVGDPVSWTLDFTATNYDGEKQVLFYTISDTLTPADWAKIDLTSITVTVGTGTDAETATYQLLSDPNDTDSFKIKIPWVDANNDPLFDATEKVTVTYSAVVTDAAVANNPSTLKNTAILGWDTNDLDDEPDKEYDDDTDSITLNLGVTKTDGDTGANLDGAQFTLYYDEACQNPVKVTKESDGVYVVDPTNGTELFTTKGGTVVIKGLKAATSYYLKEIEAPAGYNKLDGATEIVLSADTDNDEFEVGDNTYTVYNTTDTIIENNQGTELPSTGGKGTMMLITFGTMIAVAFAILMITQKKMSIYND